MMVKKEGCEMEEMKSERRRQRALIFTVLFAILVVVSVGCASATTIYVPDDYAKIQWAVDNATAGDTIIVRDGTYTENVDVNKTLTIRSENGSANCVVNALASTNHIFHVTEDYVNISGFTIKGTSAHQTAGIKLPRGILRYF